MRDQKMSPHTTVDSKRVISNSISTERMNLFIVMYSNLVIYRLNVNLQGERIFIEIFYLSTFEKKGNYRSAPYIFEDVTLLEENNRMSIHVIIPIRWVSAAKRLDTRQGDQRVGLGNHLVTQTNSQLTALKT